MNTRYNLGLNFNFLTVKRALLVSTCAGLTLAAFSQDAFAQTGLLDPSQVERRFDEPEVPPSVPGEIAPKPAAKEGQAVGAERFVLSEVKFEGATVYTPEQLKATYADMIGKEITTADIRKIAAAVSNKYRADGYIISQAMVPDQTITDGTVQIRVIEGYVNNISIEGQHVERPSHGLVEAYAAKIKSERPLTTKTLERYVLLTDDLPGVTAKVVFRPTGADPAAVDMVVLLAHKKYEASISTDNRGTKILGPHQHTATATANSLFGIYDRTLVRGIVTTPIDELQFFDIQHEEQLGTEGTRLVFIASHTRTEPGEWLTPLDIEGRSTSGIVRVQHPFIRSRTENLSGRGTFNYRETETDVLGVDGFTEDQVAVVRAGGSYDIADKFKGVNLFDAEISQGLDILGATDTKSIRNSRADADGTFTKLNFDASRLQNLPYGFSLLTAATGQYSFDPLLAGEEFSLGGIGFGQAYDPSELSADHGAALKIELRYGRAADWTYLQSYQLYTYYDIGSVWQENSPAGVDDQASLANVGVGLRANFTPIWSGTAEVGIPLTRDVALEQDDDARFFFSVTGRF